MMISLMANTTLFIVTKERSNVMHIHLYIKVHREGRYMPTISSGHRLIQSYGDNVAHIYKRKCVFLFYLKE